MERAEQYQHLVSLANDAFERATENVPVDECTDVQLLVVAEELLAREPWIADFLRFERGAFHPTQRLQFDIRGC